MSSICPRSMTLTFYLLTPKSNQFIFVQRCTSNKSLEKIHQCISRKQHPGRTDASTHARTEIRGRTKWKHNASGTASYGGRIKIRNRHLQWINKMHICKGHINDRTIWTTAKLLRSDRHSVWDNSSFDAHWPTQPNFFGVMPMAPVALDKIEYFIV